MTLLPFAFKLLIGALAVAFFVTLLAAWVDIRRASKEIHPEDHLP